MKNSYTRIDFEIYVVFIVLIAVSVFNAIYSTVIISRNQGASTKIMTVDVPSLQMLENMNLVVTRSKMFATNWVYLQSDKEDKEKLKSLHESEYPLLKGDLMATMTLWDETGPQDTLKTVLRNFDELIAFEKQIMKTLVSFDDYEDPMKKFSAEEILETQVLPRSTQIISALNNIIISRKMQADAAHNAMIESSRNLMWGVLGIAILIVLVVLLAGFYLSNSIIVPVMKLKNYILQMGKGEIPEIQMTVGRNAVGQITEAVKTLVGGLERTAQFANSIGDGNFNAEFQPLSSKDELGNALLQMRDSLSKAEVENKRRNWEATGIAEINQVLRENSDEIEKLSDELIKSMVQYLDASCGGFYLFEENSVTGHKRIKLIGKYALSASHKSVFEIGEGFVGQAVKNEQVIHITDIPQNHFKTNSGLVDSGASQLLVVPIMHQGMVYGAIEFGSFKSFSTFQTSFLGRIGEIIGSAMASSIANSLTKNLLEETQYQAEQLKAQEEKLRKTNDELSIQGELLKSSKEELKTRNEELKIKAELLQSQNERLEQATGALEVKARELEMTNKYKSEFLANMSHELRTPLNSVLILARLLAENKNRTLNEKETEYARVIHKSGNDLLSLINDILDLSKIEAGKVELILQPTSIRQIKNNMLDVFSPIAGEKKIDLETDLHSNLSDSFITDQFRLEQVLKNLLSNALKFTGAGGKVILNIKQADRKFQFHTESLLKAKYIIEFSVMDSGIGIPAEKQKDIFEAFQQADGSTSRKYGGTGLGLSISKMLVSMLGGEMKLESEPGKGSIFYIFLPLETAAVTPVLNPTENPQFANVHIEQLEKNDFEVQEIPIPDDREEIADGDRTLLIVEDDLRFARILLDIARENNFKAIVTNRGDKALELAGRFNPCAILLDMQLPVMDGWTTLKKLKENSVLKQIPVHVMSAIDKGSLGLKLGAMSYLRKPLDKRDIDKAFEDIEKEISGKHKSVMIIDNDPIQVEILKKLIGAKGFNCAFMEAMDSESAKLILKGTHKFDILFIGMEPGWEKTRELISWVKNESYLAHVPGIVYHQHELTVEQKIFFKEYATSVEAINSENALSSTLEKFLGKIHEPSSANYQDADKPEIPENILKGKTVLVTDDDMRNVYAISTVLEEKEMLVIIAANGREAIDKLTAHPEIEIVFMDVMMPVMDGYEAIREIRKNEKWKTLPIIAVTANAMNGSREKCLECGATEYLSKPVNTEQMINLLEVWAND